VPNPPTQSEKESLESVAGDDSASELSSVGVARQASGGSLPAAPLRRRLGKVVLVAAAAGAAALLKSRRK